MFARFDENSAMTLRVIKETKRYGRMHGRTDGRTDNVKTVYPLQTKFAGGITMTQMILSSIANKYEQSPYHIGEQRRLRQAYTNMQTRQSLCCKHTKSLDVFEYSDKNLDSYPH